MAYLLVEQLIHIHCIRYQKNNYYLKKKKKIAEKSIDCCLTSSKQYFSTIQDGKKYDKQLNLLGNKVAHGRTYRQKLQNLVL
jgi:hypothetical protein